jgi:hypothetical protein
LSSFRYLGDINAASKLLYFIISLFGSREISKMGQFMSFEQILLKSIDDALSCLGVGAKTSICLCL